MASASLRRIAAPQDRGAEVLLDAVEVVEHGLARAPLVARADGLEYRAVFDERSRRAAGQVPDRSPLAHELFAERVGELGEGGVAGGGAERVMERQVGLDQRRHIRRIDGRLHLHERLFHRGHVAVARALRRELRREGLERLADLEQIVDPLRVPDRPLTPLLAQRARVGGEPHEGAGAMADLHQAEGLEELHRLPDGPAAHLQLLAQLALARELVARFQNAVVDQLGELADHALLERERADGLELEPRLTATRGRRHEAATAGPGSEGTPSRMRQARAASTSITTLAPTRAVWPDGSSMGATSTQSTAAIGPAATISSARTNSRPVMPPISGPQVPHA